METARDNALKDSACDLHHDDDFPWLTKALYAMWCVRTWRCPTEDKLPFNRVR
jgi:hypothetical protein